MTRSQGALTKKADVVRWAMLRCGILALLLAGCSSGGVVEESSYDGPAVVQATSNGGYRTISGNPVIVVNDNVEPENMLPYGGGDEGIRQAEDESTFSLNN